MSVIEPSFSIRIILLHNCFIIIHIASGLTGAPLWRLHITLASGVFLKGCSLSQSLTYGNESVRSMGPVPVLDSCGISPSPYRSFNLICFIFRSVTSWFLASKSQKSAKAALFLLYCSYFIIESSSSRSHNSVSKYELIRLDLFSLILAKVGVSQSSCVSISPLVNPFASTPF